MTDIIKSDTPYCCEVCQTFLASAADPPPERTLVELTGSTESLDYIQVKCTWLRLCRSCQFRGMLAGIPMFFVKLAFVLGCPFFGICLGLLVGQLYYPWLGVILGLTGGLMFAGIGLMIQVFAIQWFLREHETKILAKLGVTRLGFRSNLRLDTSRGISSATPSGQGASSVNDLVITNGLWPAAVYLFGWLLLFLFGCSMGYGSFRRDFSWGMLACGVIAALIGGVGVMLNVRRIFDRSPKLVLKTDGLVIHLFGDEPKFFPWSQISDLKLDKDSAPAKPTSLRFKCAGTNAHLFSYNLRGLSYSAARIFKTILQRVEAARNNTVEGKENTTSSIP